jgi:hypothetical protein
MAASAPPPVSSVEAAANCADPAKVVIDMTIAAAGPIPADPARSPKEAPNSTGPGVSGAIARAPSRVRASTARTYQRNAEGPVARPLRSCSTRVPARERA